MPVCRVYLFTYRRNDLLPRAVESLRRQTLTDWVCEVHNDDPADGFPSQYIASLHDDRFLMKDHTENLGGVRSFNLAFSGCGETYACILEDDNWWEPGFLAEMTALMDRNPYLSVAWSNMRLWQESAGNNWTDTGRTTWPDGDNTLFAWPQQRQVIGHLHSTGAMVYRGSHAPRYLVPDNTLLDAVEMVRERTFGHPVCLEKRLLANFAITLQTNRSSNPLEWTSYQLMLLASYIETADDQKQAFAESLKYHRPLKPTPIANFFLANMLLLKTKTLYRQFTISDWIAIAKWLLRNGPKLGWMKKYLADRQNVYAFLLSHTANRQQGATNKINQY